MKVWKMFTLVFVIVTVAEVALARVASWQSATVQTALLVTLQAVALAFLLVAYFDWRAQLKTRVVASDDPAGEPARAA